MTVFPRPASESDFSDVDAEDQTCSLQVVQISEQELAERHTSPENVQEGLEVFHRDGMVVLSDAIPHEPLDILRNRMLQELPEVLGWSDVRFNQGRSTKNVSQSPPLSPEFMFEDVIQNQHAISIIERLLGPKPQLAYIGGNTCLPFGIDRQSVHSDIQPPYPDFTFGVEMNIYLQPVSEANGVTEFWLGTHNSADPSDQVDNPIFRGIIKKDKLEERRQVVPPIQPRITKGSIVLRDLRLWHSGMPNKSADPRFMLGFVFFPSWYRSPMRMTLPASVRPLVEAWQQIDVISTSRFVEGPVDHIRSPFVLNLTQKADGDGREFMFKVKHFVAQYMRKFDLSHNYEHITRVHNLARYIAKKEQSLHPEVHYERNIVSLASLLHDVGDHKYLREGEDGANMVEVLLSGFGMSLEQARRVQEIVTHVSYTKEIKNPAIVKSVLERHPELAVVQDADRLDAIGAIGIGRCFAYASAQRSEHGMKGAIDHFVEKLEKVEFMMKTETGKRMARARTDKLKMFRQWWDDELNAQE